MVSRPLSFETLKPNPDKVFEVRSSGNAAARSEERRLVRQAKAGDKVALRKLLETLAAPVHRFGRRFCRNEDDAQDVMQDALAGLLRALPEWRGDAALSSWAYTVARNTCSRMRRRRAGAPARLESLTEATALADARQIASPGADPAREFERTELRDALERALASLPVSQREVVVLRDVEGLSAPEVGNALGLREVAVKSRLHRGRLALRRALAAIRDDAPARAHTDCPDTARMLSRSLEGEIDAATCRRMSKHVAQCADCRKACKTLRAALGACARLGRGPLPPAAKAAVRQALRTAASEPAKRNPPRD